MDAVIAALILTAVNLAAYGLILLIGRLLGNRALPRHTNAELDVLGCLWQLPRHEGESYGRYRRRLSGSVYGRPRQAPAALQVCEPPHADPVPRR